MDVRLPDGTIVRNVPAGTTRSQLMARVGKARPQNRTGTQGLPKPESSLAGLFLQGATFGLSDEIMGGAGALVDAAMSPFSSKVDFNPKASYQAHRNRERQRIAATRKDKPWASTGMELVGGITQLPAGAVKGAGTLLGSLKQGAASGAKAGAVAGFGYGEGADSSVAGAGLGAVGGGVLGAAIPAVARVGGKTIRAAASYLKPETGIGRELFVRAAKQDKLTPKMVGEALDAARARGVPLMPGDLGDNLRGLTGAVSRKPGGARTLVKSAVDERQMGQADRIRGAISRDLGDITNPFQASDDLIQQARAAAKPLYEEAYSAPPITTEKLDALLSTPAGKGALGRARTIAANEGRDPMGLGFSLNADGDVILNPVNADSHGAVAAARSAYDEAIAAAEKARAFARGGGGGARIAPATVRVEQAKQALEAAEASLAKNPTAGVATTRPGYTTQTLDYVKRGLDDIIEAQRDPVTRRLNLDEGGRAINGVRAQLLTEMDSLNPVYGRARAAYAGPASANQALQQGRKALNASAQEVERMTANLSAADKQQFALGYRAAMAEALERKVDGADKVGTLLGTPRKRAALSGVFGEEADLPRFVDTMADERLANETYRTVSSGSQTANRLADDALLEDQSLLEDVAGKALKGATNGGLTGMLAEIIHSGGDAIKFGAGKTGERAREDAAALLSQVDPVGLKDALREALRQQALRRVGTRTIDRNAVRAGTMLGRGAGGIIGSSTRPIE